MPEFIRKLFISDFMPHGHCYYWDPLVLWLNVVSDAVIALSYYAIPPVLFSFARRRKDLTFQWIFAAFGMFILACGTTHLMAVWTVWNATYRLDGVIKAITAASSIVTAALLLYLKPMLLALPSPAQLERVNEGLAREIEVRKTAEKQVQRMNADLELRVEERTVELRKANDELRAEIDHRHSLEAQLIQSQKMEAIGRLAGGVAHDFNNILTVMLGFTEMMLASPEATESMREQLDQVRNAGLRAASLTRQLLTFSRKQVFQPKVIDLGQIVSEIEKMLQRLLGDDIHLLTRRATGLGRVKADPSQIEQVIVNLAVNARDAMPAGGNLTIETANVTLDETYCREHVDTQPGAYVMLAMSDSGHGMNAETQARIFEPFFTTKEPGKGTGLGLSTVFGIVKQSGGHIWVYSEPGHGTTFKVYLPRVEEAVPETTAAAGLPARGGETVLVCEDDPSVRTLVRTALASLGYTVLEAGSAQEALLFRSRFTGAIHLLLTDLVLPEVGGRELANQLRVLIPDLRVLFMSGYTEQGVVHRGALEEGVSYIQKPFTPQELSRKIREVLDSQ